MFASTSFPRRRQSPEALPDTMPSKRTDASDIASYHAVQVVRLMHG
jgi:hypothetical protein